MTPPADEPTSCVKCGYVRQPADSAPDYECPRCGVVYAKAEVAMRAQERARDVEARRVIAGERRAPPLERPEPADPAPERDADPPRLAAHIVYLLYAIPVGVTALDPKAAREKLLGASATSLTVMSDLSAPGSLRWSTQRSLMPSLPVYRPRAATSS